MIFPVTLKTSVQTDQIKKEKYKKKNIKNCFYLLQSFISFFLFSFFF